MKANENGLKMEEHQTIWDNIYETDSIGHIKLILSQILIVNFHISALCKLA